MAGSALQVAVDVFVGTDSFQIDQSNAVIAGVAQQVQLAEAAKLVDPQFGEIGLLLFADVALAFLDSQREGVLDILFSWCVRECISCPGVQLRPGVQQAYVRGLEVTDVSCNHRQAVHQGSGRDEGVALRTWVWNMQPRAAPCDSGIDRKDSSVKSRQHVFVEPCAQEGGLRGISPLDEQDAQFELQHGNCRQEHRAGGRCLSPGGDPHVGLARSGLAQLGNDVGIEQVHQERSAGRKSGALARTGSNSMSSRPGMASRSTMLGCLAIKLR